ncbi:competence protein ComEC, partial [Klebsiella pneumoniae]
MDLIVDSAKTPEAVEESAFDSALSSIFRAVKAATAYIKSLWGEEYFPPEPTSRENEMSVVQSAVLNGHRVM